ncbi:hypothetical protein [Streptomyces rugosispiralis]|uniref:Uncharacterized protein n=1 Tax=Streptomyces rugosispiralis TaxID=2967341 RepID=A0ABT1VCH4_9ACTN|nr:hypothetical protein [Streptomyces rugosispiralis]MCQ8194668.1 hypothetical protein [Streptomyces rugosispiralis]
MLSAHSLTNPLGAFREALPAKGADDLARYGVVLGRRVRQARQFRHVGLPAGWTGRGDRFGVWTHVVDQYGRTRARVGWEPFDYPPAARTTVVEVWQYVLAAAEFAEPFAMDEVWATPQAVADALIERIRGLRQLISTDNRSIERWGDYWLGDHFGWASDQRRKRVAKLAANQALLTDAVAAGARLLGEGAV